MSIHPSIARAARLQAPKPSAPEKPDPSTSSGCTFGFEQPPRFFIEARRLIAANVAEAFPDEELDPDFDRCDAFIAAGVLHVWATRYEGGLIGYTVWLTVPSAYFRSQLWAFCEMYYLTPEHRTPWLAARMFRTGIEALRARGAERFQVRYRNERLGKFFKRLLKFKDVETVAEL